jgi:hypothetical protein
MILPGKPGKIVQDHESVLLTARRMRTQVTALMPVGNQS